MQVDEVLKIYAEELLRCKAAPAAELVERGRLLVELDREIQEASDQLTSALDLETSFRSKLGNPRLPPAIREVFTQNADEHGTRAATAKARVDALALKRDATSKRADGVLSPEAYAWRGTRTRVHERLQGEQPSKTQEDLWPPTEVLVQAAGITEDGLWPSVTNP